MSLRRILPALLSVILLVSSGCADYDAEFKRVDDRIDEIENNRIPSIDKQLEKINASLLELERTDLEIKKMIPWTRPPMIFAKTSVRTRTAYPKFALNSKRL